MKTAEDWIRDNYGEHWLWSSCEWGSEDVIEAMEQYANARLQELSLTDMAEEYIKKELPNAEKPFHYDAEGAVCIRDFVKWARNKLTGK